MKLHLMLPLLITASLALVCLIHVRSAEQEEEHKRHRFQNIKLRMSNDVLADLRVEHDNIKGLIERGQLKVKEQEDEVKKLEASQKLLAGDLLSCKEAEKYASNIVAELQKEDDDLKASSTKEKSSWENEVASLQSQMKAQSKVCDYLTTGKLLDIISHLCPDQAKEAQKQQEAKLEELKQQELAKAEAPKQPDAEAPKQEEQPKAEAPKQEEQPKAEAPKQEEQPKAEAPKQPEAEAPKQLEQAKAEAPKQEEQPKAEAPKQEEQPKAEAPKQEEQPKAEAPKQEEQPKAEAPKQEEQPKAEAPKQEEKHKVETLR
ncbi:uncharacterized protein LOC143003240 [Genypterus blacodes]|uniref:uncharacterized protein LOC143003240 n=1 Tax=Genypterus blacodes TaxID=154954 RepID=UPI003F767B33